MTSKVVIDFECKDKYIGLGLGAGWAYAFNHDTDLFTVLGCSIQVDDGNIRYITDHKEILRELSQYDSFVAHNAQYELGCLHVLVKQNPELSIDLSRVTVYDTKILAKLVDSTLRSYSLEELSRLYLKKGKRLDSLIQAAIELSLYAPKEAGIDERKALKIAYSNMDLIQQHFPDTMADYCNQDVELTNSLYNYFMRQHIEANLLQRYSNLLHACVTMRLRGVCIDIARAEQIYLDLIPIIVQKHQAVYEIAGKEFNINSPKEVPAVFDTLGINYPKTEKGNPSITSPWLEQNDHPICQALVEVRKYKKIQADFIRKILDMQEFTAPGEKRIGKLYPELHILEANTGRFSCSNPNIQQIPSKDPELGKLCRSIFIPNEGETWYSLDFSNQEGRLQVHYANLLKCEGASEIVLEFNRNPNLDMHQFIADKTMLDRKVAKTINLGLSYGMGTGKLAKSLGITDDQAYLLADQYHQWAPFLKELNNKCKTSLKNNKYIRTLGGRKVLLDPPEYHNGEKKTFEYKALNKLIQGSAADQITEVIVQAHKEGLPLLFPVHDEICLSGTKEQAERVKAIMESIIPLTIPMVVDIIEGSNWGETL